LGELHGDAGGTLLAKLGAQVCLSTKVSAIEPLQDGGFRIGLAQGAQGESMTADAVVLAVPHEKAAPLMPAGALPEQTVAGWAGTMEGAVRSGLAAAAQLKASLSTIGVPK